MTPPRGQEGRRPEGGPGEGSGDLRAANLAAIRSHSPEVAARLALVEPRSDLEIHPSVSGALTARTGTVALHSTYDPVREARRLVAGTVSGESTACVVIGLGLGYHVEALLDAHPDLPVVLVEGDLGLLAAALGARDLTRILASPSVRLLLAATPEEVASVAESLPLRAPAILAPSSLRALDPEYFRRVEAAVLAAADRKQINVNTLGRFGVLWVRNLLRNAEALVTSPGVSELEGRFQGLPALILAAGPSLDEVEPLLAGLASRVVLIAVDSSLGTCLRCGVEPDFVVTVDPQYWNTRYFDRLRPGRTILVCEPSTHPSSIRRLALPTFFTSSLFPLGKLLETFTGEKGRIGAGGSVATSAWDVARLMGCGPIFMAGLDLGFPDRRTHARGMYFEELMAIAATRTLPAETRSFRYLTEAGSLRVPSTDGGLTLTDRRMLVYKWWFERQLAKPAAPETRTLGARGVAIGGIPYAEPRSLDRLPEVRGEVCSRCDAARAVRLAPESSARARGAVSRALEELLGDLRGISASAAQGLVGIAGLENALASARKTVVRRRLAELDAVDRRVLSSASREMVGFLMQPLIAEVTGSRGAASAVESSRRLYRELAEASALHADLVFEALRALRGRGPSGS